MASEIGQQESWQRAHGHRNSEKYPDGATLVGEGHAPRKPSVLIAIVILIVIEIAIVIDPVSDCDDDYDGDEEQAQKCLQCGLCRFGIRRPFGLARAPAIMERRQEISQVSAR